MTKPSSAPHRLSVSLVFSVGLALLVGVIGAVATAHSVETWYRGLTKPWFNPPNIVFGPVWTALYILMGIAAWRVHRCSTGAPRRSALLLYAVQLLLNLAWTLIFFGLERPLLGLAELAALWVAVLGTTWAFGRIDHWAGWIFTLYALWTSFAFLLNFEIWRLNP